jgi:prepilin-type N-terminal cleavage/methylation domain-containing protein
MLAPGFSLIETLMAATIVIVAFVGLAQLSMLAIAANQRARTRTTGAVLAQEKIEELMAATADIEPGADFIDARGRRLGAGDQPPPGTLFIRRWSAGPPSGVPPETVVQVWVALAHQGGAADVAYLAGVKFSRSPRRRRAGRGKLPRARAQLGFTLIEMLIAASLSLCITAAIVAAVHPAESVFTVESETSDVQQRLRIAADTLFKDLVQAGAGTDAGADKGSLIDFLPPVLPYRPARVGGDPPETVRSDVITLFYVPSRRSQATIASPMPAASGIVRINAGFGCPLSDAVCGLSASRTVLIYDSNGSFDRYRVDGAEGSLLTLFHTTPDSPRIYPAGSRIVEAMARSYFLRPEPSTGGFQLVRDDGDERAVAPVVDHVVQLTFRYFGDPRPPMSPPPPAASDQPTSYPPGENCVALRDPASAPAPRLPALVPDSSGLTELPAALLGDGPWCPDDGAPNRFDADLLRIRAIAVALRVESANAALRGASGDWFQRPGTSGSGRRFVPDRTLTFQVSPRNMAVVR